MFIADKQWGFFFFFGSKNTVFRLENIVYREIVYQKNYVSRAKNIVFLIYYTSGAYGKPDV